MPNFQDLLKDAQIDKECTKTEMANDSATQAIRPQGLARIQEEKLDEAWRAVALASDTLAKRVEGLTTAMALIDKVLSAQISIAAETNRFTAAPSGTGAASLRPNGPCHPGIPVGPLSRRLAGHRRSSCGPAGNPV